MDVPILSFLATHEDIYMNLLVQTEVGEVAAGFQPDGELRGLVVVVEDGQLLVEAVGHRAMADHRQLGVDVDRPGSGHEEEPRQEVLQVVDGQRVEPLAVDRQLPLRQEAGVEREQAGGIRRRGVDVALPVADDERVAVQDLDQLIAHGCLPRPARGAGRAASPGARAAAAV